MTTVYKIVKPDLTSIGLESMVEKLRKGGDFLTEDLKKANVPKYLHWDQVRHKEFGSDLTKEEYWFLLKQIRKISSTKTSIKAEDGSNFNWFRIPYTDEYLHKIDMQSGGQMFSTYSTIAELNKQKFVSRGVLEEAIASSQLEGAHTTRKVAKKMLLEKREPRNESERMIVNNYRAIEAINEDFKDRKLNKEMLFELHRMLTEGTELPENERGRFRSDTDNIVVTGVFGSEEVITHIAPKQEFVEREIERLFDYANDMEANKFVHPVIKAIFIHFWIGYLHPFVDGNGRLARTLFYWYLLKNDYWSFIYLPISTVIKKSPTQYARAYIYSEQDDYDITYFYDYHMRKIIQALEEFNGYVESQLEENKKINSLLKNHLGLNDRHKHLIHYLLADEGVYTTVTSHSTINGVVRQTAQRDLRNLVERGFLKKERVGKYVHYLPTSELREKTSK